MMKLEPDIRAHENLLSFLTSKRDEGIAKVGKLVHETLALGLQDQLQRSILEFVGSTKKPNPHLEVEEDVNPPF